MNPFFIIGNPRSGTSLFRLMLTTHPNIIVPPECHFFLWLENRYSGWNSSNGYKGILDDLFASRKFETWNLDYDDLERFLRQNRVNSFPDFVRMIYLIYGQKVGKENIVAWGDKNKLWKEKLASISKYFPGCKFIHLVRDGRDVASSFKDLSVRQIESKYAPRLPDKIEEIAERWKLNINFINTFLETIEGDNVMMVKYEDLIRGPEIILRKVCKFLDVEFEVGMLNYSITRQFDRYEPREFMQWKEKLSDPPDVTNIGKYRQALTAIEIEYFDKNCRDELIRYGYL